MAEHPPDRVYLEEKLQRAAWLLTEVDAPLKERLQSAYRDALSALKASSFPDAEGRADFEAIHAELTQVGEAGEGAGSVPTTLWLMSDETAAELAESIIALAARYRQA